MLIENAGFKVKGGKTTTAINKVAELLSKGCKVALFTDELMASVIEERLVEKAGIVGDYSEFFSNLCVTSWVEHKAWCTKALKETNDSVVPFEKVVAYALDGVQEGVSVVFDINVEVPVAETPVDVYVYYQEN